MKAVLLLTLAVAIAGCSTTAQFKIPPKTKLQIGDRLVSPDADGKWKTGPFFWDQAGGAQFYLYDENGKTIRRGKIKTKFRVVSIFWPPLAIAYWPMGLRDDVTYDLISPADGTIVRDTPPAVASTVPIPTPDSSAPAAKPVKK